MAVSLSALFLQLIEAAASDITCPADIVVLAAHSMILGHGFTCAEADEKKQPDVLRVDPQEGSGTKGAIYQKILPGDWAAACREGGAYNFVYKHPSWQWEGIQETASPREDKLELGEREMRLKALVVGGQVMFHTVDSANPDHVLSMELKISEAISDESFEKFCRNASDSKDLRSVCDTNFVKAMKRAQSLVDKKLLLSARSLNGETAKSKKGSEVQRESASANSDPSSQTTHFPAPLVGNNPPPIPSPGMFAPDGNLIGPNHPAWGVTRPGIPSRGGPPGGIPGARFDPLGPLGPFGGEPDPDHLPRPGFGHDMFF